MSRPDRDERPSLPLWFGGAWFVLLMAPFVWEISQAFAEFYQYPAELWTTAGFVYGAFCVGFFAVFYPRYRRFRRGETVTEGDT